MHLFFLLAFLKVNSAINAYIFNIKISLFLKMFLFKAFDFPGLGEKKVFLLLKFLARFFLFHILHLSHYFIEIYFSIICASGTSF